MDSRPLRKGLHITAQLAHRADSMGPSRCPGDPINWQQLATRCLRKRCQSLPGGRLAYQYTSSQYAAPVLKALRSLTHGSSEAPEPESRDAKFLCKPSATRAPCPVLLSGRRGAHWRRGDNNDAAAEVGVDDSSFPLPLSCLCQLPPRSARAAKGTRTPARQRSVSVSRRRRTLRELCSHRARHGCPSLPQQRGTMSARRQLLCR